jgi:hypothetical protein
MSRSLRSFAAALAAVLALATTACDGPSSSGHDAESPIELTSAATGGPLGGGGYRVVTDYCECVADSLLLVDGRDNVTSIECSGTYGLVSAGGDEPVVATIIGPTWRVSTSSRVPVDPHIGLRVDATCLEP